MLDKVGRVAKTHSCPWFPSCSTCQHPTKGQWEPACFVEAGEAQEKYHFTVGWTNIFKKDSTPQIGAANED